jgi:hypothetical protein
MFVDWIVTPQFLTNFTVLIREKEHGGDEVALMKFVLPSSYDSITERFYR